MACSRIVKMIALAWVALCGATLCGATLGGPALGGQTLGAPRERAYRIFPVRRHRFLLRHGLFFPGEYPPPAYAPAEPGAAAPEPLLPSPSPGLAYPSPSLTLPEGMAITIDKILPDQTDSDRRQAPPTISLPKQAARQLAACWAPPVPQQGDTVEVTLRFGFNRSGSVMWPPRITYVKPEQGMSAGEVRESIFAAFKACTPLHFSESMAASMPGYPLSVRFIGRRGEDEK